MQLAKPGIVLLPVTVKSILFFGQRCIDVLSSSLPVSLDILTTGNFLRNTEVFPLFSVWDRFSDTKKFVYFQVLLEGSPGVGKTSLVAAIGKFSGHTVVRINLSEQVKFILTVIQTASHKHGGLLYLNTNAPLFREQRV